MPGFDVAPVARALNARASDYEIGRLHTIRTELRGFSRRPATNIFTPKTTHPHMAFHHGGRSELQFNIGLEEIGGVEELRHGVAFSFETSQSLPSIDVLVPKARLFNDYMQLYSDRVADLRMWHYQGDVRSSDYPPTFIMPELVTAGNFVFLGARQPLEDIDYHTILRDFDRLLPLYRYVEGGSTKETPNPASRDTFQFRPGCTDKATIAATSIVDRELNITLKHNLLQSALTRRLIDEFGAENVADEHPNPLGKKIDVVVRRGVADFWYYEIKTAASPRACLREALGQVMEYAYWPGVMEPARLFICGECPLDEDGSSYLRKLNERFGLPVSYEQIVLSESAPTACSSN